MPELPEVECVAAELRALLPGRRVRALGHAHADVLQFGRGQDGSSFAGLRFAQVGRRGKLLLLEFEGSGLCMTVHLRMTGRLELDSREAPLPEHCHLILELDGGDQLRFSDPRRFGRVQLLTRKQLEDDRFFSRLGPEPLELSPEFLRERLARRSGRLKGALLDQSLVAGLGNIYVDEILHRAGLHPLLPASSLRPEERSRLHEAIAFVIREAVAAGGSTIRDYRRPSGEFGSFQRSHKVFGREGQPCGSCGSRVVKIVVGGRGTHLCTKCQPPRRRRARRARAMLGK